MIVPLSQWTASACDSDHQSQPHSYATVTKHAQHKLFIIRGKIINSVAEHYLISPETVNMCYVLVQVTVNDPLM